MGEESGKALGVRLSLIRVDWGLGAPSRRLSVPLVPSLPASSHLLPQKSGAVSPLPYAGGQNSFSPPGFREGACTCLGNVHHLWSPTAYSWCSQRGFSFSGSSSGNCFRGKKASAQFISFSSRVQNEVEVKGALLDPQADWVGLGNWAQMWPSAAPGTSVLQVKAESAVQWETWSTLGFECWACIVW